VEKDEGIDRSNLIKSISKKGMKVKGEKGNRKLSKKLFEKICNIKN